MSEAYAQGRQDPALHEETIGANLDRAVAAWPQRDALISCTERVRMTWAQLGDAVNGVARGLHGAGLRAGDRLGIWSPNRHEWTLVQYATARLGIILVNLNPAYRTSELAYALRQSGCRMLVAAESFKTSDYRAMVGEVRDSLPGLERVVFLGTGDWAALLAEGIRWRRSRSPPSAGR